MRQVGMTPRPIRDRFRGKSSVKPPSAEGRKWDEGQPKGHVGADIAPAKGRKGQVQSAAKLSQGRVENPGHATPDSDKNSKDLGYPMTGGPKYHGLSGGHGPKPGKKLSPGPYQGGKTKGKYVGPKPMKDRFKGGSHGM